MGASEIGALIMAMFLGSLCLLLGLFRLLSRKKPAVRSELDVLRMQVMDIQARTELHLDVLNRRCAEAQMRSQAAEMALESHIRLTTGGGPAHLVNDERYTGWVLEGPDHPTQLRGMGGWSAETTEALRRTKEAQVREPNPDPSDMGITAQKLEL